MAVPPWGMATETHQDGDEILMLTMRQFGHYATAVARHVATGSHTRTDAEVARLLAVCKDCDQYEPISESSGRCRLCGCRCNKGRSALTNKLRMASEHCPRNRW